MQINLMKLRVLRAERDWTQKEVAVRAGISQNAYSGIERGAQFPKYKSLVGIAGALGCSVDDLLSKGDAEGGAEALAARGEGVREE